LSNLVLEDCWSCGDLVWVGGFNSIFDCDACIWSLEAIAERKAQIVATGFDWVVTESLPVHERIKRGQGDLSQLFANYRQSMANLAAQGINTIC
jgi:D-mannonate dehydratase